MNSNVTLALLGCTLSFYIITDVLIYVPRANKTKEELEEFKQRAVAENAAIWKANNDGTATFTWISDLFTGPVESE